MVESLGLPRGNAEMQRLLFAEYKNNPAIRARYDLSQGHNPYYVSTTAGEVRELCGRWGDYYDLVDRKDSDCMPARLANKGYATHAMHSFIGSFFERDQWYPNIGFQKTEFGPLLIERGARNCGGVFAGACDRDVPKQMADMLKKATKPTFLYFLTVNTHLPVPPGMNLNNEDCERLSPKLEKAFPQICRQFVMWHDFNNAMVQEIAAKGFSRCGHIDRRRSYAAPILTAIIARSSIRRMSPGSICATRMQLPPRPATGKADPCP